MSFFMFTNDMLIQYLNLSNLQEVSKVRILQNAAAKNITG